MFKQTSSFFRSPAPLAVVKALIRTRLARHLKPFQEGTRGETGILTFLSDDVLAAPVKGLEALDRIAEIGASGVSGLIDLSTGYPKGHGLSNATLCGAFDWGTQNGLDFDGYPPYAGWPAVLESVAKELAHSCSQKFLPETEILLTSGATEGIALIAEAYLNPGDSVVLLEPAYLFFGYPLRLKRAKLRWVQTSTVDGFIQVDEGQLERKLKGAKLLVLNSPANPTGGVIALDLMGRILQLAERHNVLVVSDEIYQDFSFARPWTSAAAFPEYKGRVLIVHSYSKSLRLAGWRMGYIAASAGLLRPLKMSSALLSPYAPSISQALVGYLLPEKSKLIGEMRQSIEKTAAETYQQLRGGFPQLEPPCGGLFHWLPVPESFACGTKFATRLLNEKKVLVLPGEHFGPNSRQFVRLCFAGESASVKEACSRILEVVAGKTL